MMRNSAAYIGRVGGLAVALGIGTAVVAGHGMALADSTDGGAGPKSADSSEAKSEAPNAEGPGQSESKAPRKHAAPRNSLSPVRHGSSGAEDDLDPSTHDATDDGPSAPSQPSGTEGGTTVDTEPADPGPAAGTPSTGKPAADNASKPASRTVRHAPTTPRRLSQVDVKPDGDVDTSPTTGNSRTDTTVHAAGGVQAAESNPARKPEKPSPTIATLSAADNQPAVAQAAAAPQAATQAGPQIATTMLSATGLAAPTTDPLAPAAPVPTLLGLLQLTWRDMSRTFFNQSPRIAYDPAENSLVNGSVVGSVTASDPDGAVTLTAGKPAHGDVTVNPDGTFTYTPNETYNGRDSFTITASEADSGFHIHGLAGLVNLVSFGLIGDSGHTATQTINIGGYTSTTVVSGLEEATDFRFLPDGRILFTEKGGAIKATNKDGQLQRTPLITLPTTTKWARGLVGVEVDPDYEQNGHIYVSYVRSDNYQRLSRFTVTDPSADVLTVDPDSEVVLVQGTQPAGDDHHGGGLSFGPDGKLYWSVGDNVCCTVLDGRNSQDLSNIYGKVLRLNRDGSAPDDNPFPDAPGAGPLVYATGFRNPFRLAFTPDGRLLVVDVGESRWEEVNLVTAGSNYGWPNAEGPCDGIGTASCSTPSSYANPIYAYRHSPGGNSITAVTSYTGPTSGNGENRVLIADFNQGWVKELTFNSDYSTLISESLFDVAAPGATNKLAQGPDGAIYQLTYDGKLTRIALSSDGLSTA
jgi:aldose sugar dehydrogenase